MAKKSAKKSTSKFKANDKKLDLNRIAVAGGLFTTIILLILGLCSKFFGLFLQTENIFLDLFGKIGYDITYFGLILGIVYGFIFGYLLFWFYAYIYSRLPKSIVSKI